MSSVRKLFEASGAGQSSVAYRREIDGLRAIAVLGVVLYHAGFAWFSGGYVGVDVFFVMSGYLICSVILQEQEAGRFSIRHFYERRIRRIFPALFLTVAGTFLLSVVVLLPTERRDFGSSMAAVSLFASNIYFERTTGYFAIPSLQIPLIHTWSLAVEEQFYLVFPLVLLTMWRLERRIVLAVFAGAFGISLLLSQWAAVGHPVAAFYLLPTRAFELLMGILIAFAGPARLSRLPRRLLGPLALVGLGMIAYAIVSFTDATEFPGIHALVPTLGASLVVAGSSRENLAGRWLGAGPLTFIGLISYSLYLFHLPLFAFTRLTSIETPAPTTFLVLTIAAIILAALSWRFIEQPFRRRAFLSQGQVFACGAAGTIIMLGVGAAYRYDGINWWFPNRKAVESIIAAVNSINPRRDECHVERGWWIQPDSSCIFGAAVDPTWAVWGDSHADAIVDGIGKLGEQHGFSARELTYWICPPIAGPSAGTGTVTCADYNGAALRYLLDTPAISHVVMAARWSDYAEGHSRSTGPGAREDQNQVDELLSLSGSAINDPQRRDALARRVPDTVTRLIRSGKTVYLFYPVPEYADDIPRTLSIYARTGRSYEHVTLPYSSYTSRNAFMNGVLDSIPDSPQLVRIHPEWALCDTNACITYKDGKVLYHDGHHLTLEGADLVLEQLTRHLNNGW